MSDSTPEGATRHAWLVGLAIVGLGFAIRLHGIGEYWLNPDEGIYFSTLTRASTSEFWGEVMANAHPPLFYLVLRGVGHLTRDFVWLRGVALISGTAAIWALWLVGRHVGGKGWPGVVAGSVAAGLLAVNHEAIVFSQVLRPYSMLVALLGAALYQLLEYRAEPTDRRLATYVLFTSLALLTHYGAVLGFGVFLVVVAVDHFGEAMESTSWNRLAAAQVIPGVVLVTVFLLHLNAALGSYMMYLALAPDGWLSEWLVSSPGAAWHSFVSFQTLQLPVSLQGRAALLLLVAIAVAAWSRSRRGRTVAVLAGGALIAALAASVLGEYPFGPTRHDAWLVVFTLPALGWLAGYVVERGRGGVLVGAAALAVALALGGPLERALGDYPPMGSAADERALRREDVRSLVTERLDPEGTPRVLLMSFQTFNLLMPVYATERQEITATSPPDLMSFSFGSRDVIVSGLWDWSRWDDVRQLVLSLPARLPATTPRATERVLLLAGGWESPLIAGETDVAGASVLDRLTGEDRAGDTVTRLMAFELDPGAFTAQAPEPSAQSGL